MDLRTTRSTVWFARPFQLSGDDRDLPAGEYEFILEEELIQGLSFEAYRRTGSFLLIRVPGGGGATEMRPVEPQELEAALSRDRAPLG